jgi:hypothetical protein
MMVTDRAGLPGQGTVSVQRATHNATDRSVQTVDPVSRAHVREAGTAEPTRRHRRRSSRDLDHVL